ncbi:M56 family peptidase [Blastococcus sp. CT_GayMR19]|uniref:M56 family metallopeptidase n=1 Tax=Blastococcus sp. CT_GayMR19 TaxID=2559608 RepID=UPI001073DBE0|nr:M56 family metallopeptidase [Blastococcus sp. CT_GayMR19]TFV79385.1 M56 family peptidase [Blastococcus sp. CT_GayMR19]
MTTAVLLAFAAVLATLTPKVAGAAWASRAPRLAIFTWQAATVGLVGTSVLAGLTLLVPVTAVGGGLAAILHACATTIAGVYGSPDRLPAVLVGAVLAVVLPVRLTVVAFRTVLRDRRARRDLRHSIALGARAEHSLGVLVLDSDRAAAFCVPGRDRAVVLTSAALQALTPDELTGVLAHEREHLRARHHLAVTAARIVERALPGLPLVVHARVQIERLVELLADDAAARRVDPLHVASAMVTLAGMRAPRPALGAAEGSTTVRVTRLLAPIPPVPVSYHVLVGAAALATVLGPVALAAWPLVSAVSSGLCVVPGWA